MGQARGNAAGDANQWRPPTAEIPTKPGVYRFRDGQGRILYVGKAKNLRSRLTSYFQDPAQLHPRTAKMVEQARSVQWTIVATEIEALTLEFQWIKEFDPWFNVMFRDDKSYPYLSVSMGEKYPRVAISRDAKRQGTRYFGPYTHVWAIRETIDHVLHTFPVRTCSAGVFRRAQAQGRPCLLGYIDRCSAPCVGRISEEDHRHLAEELCSFMEGKTAPFIRRLEREMKVASEQMDYELAAKKRDELAALEKVQERNAIVLPDSTDVDVYSLVADELDAAVQVFYVRGGRVRGTRGWVVERADERTEGELFRDFLEQTYFERNVAEGAPRGKAPGKAIGKARAGNRKAAPVSVDDTAHTPTDAIPNSVLVSQMSADQKFLEGWLAELRGGPVKLAVPRRGAKHQLMETVTENAQHALSVYKTRRANDLTQRAQALEGLQEALGLQHAPLRIECFDVSHTGGENQVASMVVFEDGAPRKDGYRTFNVSAGEEGGKADDTAAMAEVLGRRFKRLAEGDGAAVGEDDGSLESGEVEAEPTKPRRFAYRPDLVVVDGGLPQVNAAQAALREMGVGLPVIGLAKRLEEVWLPGQSFPVILPRSSASLYLLQYLRDESHRFALRKHRARRGKAQTRSALDAIPGLGPARQKELLKTFGSVKRIRAASAADLQVVPGIGPKLADTVVAALAAQGDGNGNSPHGRPGDGKLGA